MIKNFIFFIFLVNGPALASSEMSAHDIMKKSDEAKRLNHIIAEAVLITTGPEQKERRKEFTWWKKLQSDGLHFSTLTRFRSPAEVKGEGILFLEHDKDENDVQLYLPNLKKVRRVETDQQSTSFMGSELSYSDIASPHVEDYNYKLTKEEPCGDAKCFVIEFRPASDTVRDRVGSESGTVWIQKDQFMPARVEYNDLEGKPWKKLLLSETREVDKKNHKWMSHHLEMENLKNQHKTVLQFNNVDTDKNIPDSYFTVQNLQREK